MALQRKEAKSSTRLEGTESELRLSKNAFKRRFGEREAAGYRRRGGWLSKDSQKFNLVNSASARLSNVVRSARSGLVLVERHFSL